MNMFSIRVELEGANSADYSALAEDLGHLGIIDVITGDNGGRYKMSPGEYNYVGSKTFDQVYSDAMACAGLIGKPYSVTMAAVTKWQWTGLELLY